MIEEKIDKRDILSGTLLGNATMQKVTENASFMGKGKGSTKPHQFN